MSGNNPQLHGASLLAQLLARIGRRRRIQATAVLTMTLLVGVLEMLSIGSVIPFLGILVSPERIWSNAHIRNLAAQLDAGSPQDLVLPLTVTFVALAGLAGLGRLILMFVSNRLVYAIGSDINSEIFRRSLYQPYKVHVDRNSATLVSGILLKSSSIISVVQSMMSMVASVVILSSIVIALLVADHVTTLAAVAVFGAIYSAVVGVSRARLFSNSKHISRNSDRAVHVLQEGFGGIRDVLLDGSQAEYCGLYRAADQELRRAKAENLFIAGSPRVVLESIGVMLIAVFAYRLNATSGGLSMSLPMVGALVMGALRMLPQMQQAYAAWAQYAANRALLRDVLLLMDQPYDEAMAEDRLPALPFEREVRLRDVRFRYSPDGHWVLDGLNLTIRKGDTIGFVGTTGSGKSTAIDLVMGLLDPVAGALEVDGKPVSAGSMRPWQKNIAHVPQTVFLKDASIADNIAFNAAAAGIDMERVRMCAARAQLAEFVDTLPEGYGTYVGERGVRLSGGQRQRIGIARALYKRAPVLVLDEATSALDAATERAVMESIGTIDAGLTTLIIAHRLTTLKSCDRVYSIEAGRAVAIESLDRLLLPEENKESRL